MHIEVVWNAVAFWFGVGLTIANILIVLVLVPRIIAERRESGATLAWVFFIVLVPILGLIAFWVIGQTRLRLRRRRRQRAEVVISGKLAPILLMPQGGAATCPVSPTLRGLTRRLDPHGPMPGNAVELFLEGAACFRAIEDAIANAMHHVHLTYYIWETDALGARMRDLLIEAVKRKVEVRLLVDDVGARGTQGSFFTPLKKAGGKVERFLPVSLFTRRLPLNNRNHRKVIVVDGRIGFTGGMNVGDEYMAPTWRDAHVRLEGPAVLRLQEVFAQDWYHQKAEDLAQPKYFPDIPRAGPCWAQVVASGPDDEAWSGIATMLFAAVCAAQERAWIMTPYFVPDPPMLMALRTAALRGVDVRIVTSRRLDHQLMVHAARSFYRELISAGVKVFELDAMLHAKIVVVDKEVSTVGSANFDRRSFKLNFEANVFFYGADLATTLGRAVEDVERVSKQVDALDVARRPAHLKILEALMRILAPIL